MPTLSRLAANQQIIAIISNYASQHPDMRFHQILQNLSIEIPGGEDSWYEESTMTLEKLHAVTSKC